MGILTELSKKGMEVIKSDRFYRGFCNTSNGIVTSIFEDKCETGIYFLRLKDSNGKDNIIPCLDSTTYIVSGTEYEGKINSINEAEQLAKEGKIYSFKNYDLYAEYYNFNNNEELECCFKYGYSSRSRKYIEAVMKNIGLINYMDTSNGLGGKDGEPSKFDMVCKYSLYANANTEIGKIQSDLWIAQTCYSISVDDFAVIKMYFSRKPSVKDVEAAFQIRRFEKEPIEIFKCWECGNTTNWLDIEGSIERKLDMIKEEYCGC